MFCSHILSVIFFSVFDSILECEKVIRWVVVGSIWSVEEVSCSEPGFLDLRLRNRVTVATAATTILTTIFGEHANVPDVAPGVSHTRLHLTLSTLWGCNYILILGMRYLVIREITLSRSWDSNTHISNSSTKSVNKRKKIPLQYH